MSWLPHNCTSRQALQDALGLLPLIVRADDPRPVVEQINERYAHGGGWRPIEGFTVKQNGIYYPGDGIYHTIGGLALPETDLRPAQTFMLYEHAMVGLFEVGKEPIFSRCD